MDNRERARETNFVGRKHDNLIAAVRKWDMLGTRWKWVGKKPLVSTYDNSSIKIMCNYGVWGFSRTKRHRSRNTYEESNNVFERCSATQLKLYRSEGTVFRSVSNLNISFQLQICANFENNASFELQSRFYVICFAEKQALDGSKPEPAIRSCDTGHRKPCFDSCHFTTTRPRKFPPRKYNISPSCQVDCKLPSHSPSACTDGRS